MNDKDYIELNTGDILQKGDEYTTMTNLKNGGSLWRSVPDFLIGDKIIGDDITKWRRPIKNVPPPAKKKWFSCK